MLTRCVPTVRLKAAAAMTLSRPPANETLIIQAKVLTREFAAKKGGGLYAVASQPNQRGHAAGDAIATI